MGILLLENKTSLHLNYFLFLEFHLSSTPIRKDVTYILHLFSLGVITVMIFMTLLALIFLGDNKVEQAPIAQQTKNDANIDADVGVNTGMFDF